MKDPEVAEKLVPKDHGSGTRRVLLVDIRETPIERITPKVARPAMPSTISTCSSTLLPNEVSSWFTGVNSNVEGKQTRIVACHGGSAPAYRAWCDEVAVNGYRELALA